MAVSSSELVPVPESWQSYFEVKPGYDYRDVLKTELHIWKINALNRGCLKSKAEKKRFLQKHWDSYYVVISDNLVLIFEDYKQPTTSKPQDYIKLSPRDKITAQVKTSEKHKYCFAIKTAHKDDRDWVFSAGTADEMQKWMAALEAIIDFMNHGRVKKWSLKILEKVIPFTAGLKTEDDEEISRHEYNYIPCEEIRASDEVLYDSVQPDETYLTDMELSLMAGKFGYRWKAFAREKLLLSQSDIECIEGKNKNDLKEQMFDALLLWRRKQVEPNLRAKLIALLKSSQYCDPEAWLCLEKPDSYGCPYVTLKKGHTKECSSHTYDNVTPRKQTMQEESLTEIHRAVIYGAGNKNWNDVTAEFKEKNQKSASTQWNKTNR
ncbi:hypothetical protein HOLleu_33826 [Holothuria leucospilota]|uniref:PH domain-containing protein n=1 Tax=Holothuria leucospilota TaxID=206669 RepID=A0A9Q1BI74_HOLLE|nr:hypothetical protein HOLleu_33826 [Holothuria leucospilota]